MNGLPFQPGQRVETNTPRRLQADEAARKLSAQARSQTSANRFQMLSVNSTRSVSRQVLAKATSQSR